MSSARIAATVRHAAGIIAGMDDGAVVTGAATGRDATLRPAVADDGLCLSVLGMQVFLDTYATHGIRPAIAREVLSTFAPALLRRAIASPDERLVVAERRQHLLGFAHVTLGATHALAPGGVQAELLRLYVQEPFTGAGLGTRLLAAAEDAARATGAAVLWLTSWSHNHRALAFYARRGYADHGPTQHVFEGQSHDNRVMARQLGERAPRA